MDMYGKAKKMEGMGGGVGEVMGKNPNEHPMMTDSPEGPFSHMMGFTGDGGCHGDETVTSKGSKFYFK